MLFEDNFRMLATNRALSWAFPVVSSENKITKIQNILKTKALE
jgi:hypothetical protein